MGCEWGESKGGDSMRVPGVLAGKSGWTGVRVLEMEGT